MFELKKVQFKKKSYGHFEIDGINSSPKKLGQGHLYNGVASPLMLTTFRKFLERKPVAGF